MNDSADLDTAFFEMLEDVNRNYQEDCPVEGECKI